MRIEESDLLKEVLFTLADLYTTRENPITINEIELNGSQKSASV